MNRDDIKKLDTLLEKREAEVIAQLREIAIENPAVKGDSDVKIERSEDHDMDESTQKETNLERDFALERQLEEELRSIRDSREKIKKGTYGACDSCNNPIEAKRLQAIPVANLCVSCVKKSASSSRR